MLAASVILLFLVLDFAPFEPVDGNGGMVLSRKDGLLLLTGLVLYLFYTVKSKNKKEGEVILPAKQGPPVYFSIFNIIIGIAGLYFGAEFIISSSVTIAESLGAGTMTLGIIIGLGTSLPELATGINCAIQRETDLGNRETL